MCSLRSFRPAKSRQSVEEIMRNNEVTIQDDGLHAPTQDMSKIMQKPYTRED